MHKALNIVGFAAFAVLVATPASAGGILGGLLGGLFGGGKGAPGPEAAVGLPFLAIAGAYALMRKRRTAKAAK